MYIATILLYMDNAYEFIVQVMTLFQQQKEILLALCCKHTLLSHYSIHTLPWATPSWLPPCSVQLYTLDILTSTVVPVDHQMCKQLHDYILTNTSTKHVQ